MLSLAALVEDPLGQVDEGVAVGVGGRVDHVAEALGDLLERYGGLVGRTSGGFVVQVPEDDYLLLLWGVDALLGLDHVDFGGGGAGSDDGPFPVVLSVAEEERRKWMKGGAGRSVAD